MRVAFLLLVLLPLPFSVHAKDLGELSANPAGLSGFSGLFSSSGSLVFRSVNQMNETNQTDQINPFSVRPTRQTK